MKRTIKTDFKCSRENLDKLFACNRISAMVYNKVLDLQKEYRKDHNGEWISDKKLFEATKGIYAINSQSVQAVVQKYLAARAATKLARDKGLKNQYPWRHKKSYTTTWKANGFKLINSKLLLSLAIVQIPHGLLRQKLKYQCELYGIKYIEQEESYTSKASFFDDDELPKYNADNPQSYWCAKYLA